MIGIMATSLVKEKSPKPSNSHFIVEIFRRYHTINVKASI